VTDGQKTSWLGRALMAVGVSGAAFAALCCLAPFLVGRPGVGHWPRVHSEGFHFDGPARRVPGCRRAGPLPRAPALSKAAGLPFGLGFWFVGDEVVTTAFKLTARAQSLSGRCSCARPGRPSGLYCGVLWNLPGAAAHCRLKRGCNGRAVRFGDSWFRLNGISRGQTAAMTEVRTLGGTCVNRGCLISKNLIDEAAKISALKSYFPAASWRV
jgi:hypothetical protein